MITPFFVLFGLMAIGYLCAKRNWLDATKNEGLGNIMVYVALPSLILSSMIVTELYGQVLINFVMMTALSVSFFFLCGLMAKVYIKLARVPGRLASMVELSMLSSNNGFMGFPVTIAYFGQQGLILMVANNLAMGIVVWSYGLYILKKTKRRYEDEEHSEKDSILQSLKLMLNPTILAVLAGIVICLTRINSHIPEPLVQLLSVMGGLATPLSMIYIGVTLCGSSILSLFRKPLVMGPSIIRLTLFSAVIFTIVSLLPLYSLMKQMLFLVAVLPSAAIVPAMAGKYSYGAEEASQIVAMSTVLSVVCTPLGVFLALTFL